MTRPTKDFERICALPRRVLTEDYARACAQECTQVFRVRGSSEVIRPWQGAALVEAAQNNGLWGAFPVGIGKALANTEEVQTPAGPRPISNLHPGDFVIGRDGHPTRVLGVYPQGEREVLRVTFSDGRSVVCDSSHLWTFRVTGGGADRGRIREETRTALEWSHRRLKRKCGEHGAHTTFVPMIAPVDAPEANLPIDPYTLGALLGDGSLTHSLSFTSMDRDIVERLRLPGCRLRPKAYQNSGRAVEYAIIGTRSSVCHCGRRCAGRGLCKAHYYMAKRTGALPPKCPKNPLSEALRRLGLHGRDSRSKFIPAEYFRGSVAQRLDLLRGLLDTDGSVVNSGAAEYSTMSPALAHGVRALVESLGGTARLSQPKQAFRLYIKLPPGMTLFFCERKRSECGPCQRPPYRAVVSIEPAGRARCTCIKVEAVDGLFATTGYVLTHNTLISYLLPRAMGAKRVVIVVPASLREKTHTDFALLFRDWGEIGAIVKVVSVQELAPESGAGILEGFRPDLIIIDEAHKLMNRNSSASRRIDRYVVAVQDGVRVVALTGTPSRKSVMGYWHILCWCLRDRAPIPLNEGEAESWAAALDETGGSWFKSADPGVLGRDRESACAWFRKRLHETPGVIVLDQDSAGNVPLTIRYRIAPEDAELDAHYEVFGVKQENPGGISVTDPLGRWLLDAQMAAGLYSRYVVPPPKPWIEARRDAARFVRDAIDASTHTARPLDTEAQVFRRYPKRPEVLTWQEIRPSFDPETEVVWLTQSAIQDACAWLRESSEPGIVWVNTVEFGRALSTVTRLSYYGAEGKNASGVSLHRAPVGKSLIASWNACREGFNLQEWRRNLVVQPPQSALIWEQILGRPHRSKQTRPVVFDVLMGSGGSIDAFEMAIREAERVRAREGLTQKLLRARIERREPRITASNAFRWARRTKTLRDTPAHAKISTKGKIAFAIRKAI